MMKHVTHLVQGFLDGELAPDQEAAVRRHVAECAECRGELAATRKLWHVVDGAAAAAAPAPLWPGIADNLPARTATGPWTWPQRGLAATALAAGILLGVGMGASTDSGDAGGELVAGVQDDYLQDGLPTLDQIWLETGANEEDGES